MTTSYASCSGAEPNDEAVEHWLKQGAGVPGYVGFAIGRTIWWDALKGFLDGNIERDEAAEQIGDKYRHFIDVYEIGVAEPSGIYAPAS